MSAEKETLPLSQAAMHLLQECRMVLPGVQALFGFQLVAVFNDPFFDKMTKGEQSTHLVALFLVAVSAALVMTPAAYHRQTNPNEVTKAFIKLSTRLLMWSMWPLMLGITLDYYLIMRLIVMNKLASALTSFVLLVIFISLWFVFPRIRRGIQHGEDR